MDRACGRCSSTCSGRASTGARRIDARGRALRAAAGGRRRLARAVPAAAGDRPQRPAAVGEPRRAAPDRARPRPQGHGPDAPETATAPSSSGPGTGSTRGPTSSKASPHSRRPTSSRPAPTATSPSPSTSPSTPSCRGTRSSAPRSPTPTSRTRACTAESVDALGLEPTRCAWSPRTATTSAAARRRPQTAFVRALRRGSRPAVRRGHRRLRLRRSCCDEGASPPAGSPSDRLLLRARTRCCRSPTWTRRRSPRCCSMWLLGVILWCAFSVIVAADHLAEMLGEPFGTLILTLQHRRHRGDADQHRDARRRRAHDRPGHDVRGDDDRAQRRDRALARRSAASSTTRRTTACPGRAPT